MGVRGDVMVKSMDINDVSNAGDKRVKGRGMVLNSRFFFMGVKKGLKKITSRG